MSDLNVLEFHQITNSGGGFTEVHCRCFLASAQSLTSCNNVSDQILVCTVSDPTCSKEKAANILVSLFSTHHVIKVCAISGRLATRK